jgi:hypothetical protein
VLKHVGETRHRRAWFGGLAALPLAIIFVGCSPAGTGSIDVNSEAIRAKVAGDPASTKPATPKKAAALKADIEAAKKNPKLH